MDWGIYAWFKRGKRRKETLKIIAESKNPITINDIKHKSKIALSQASATVKELEQKKLIECLNPKDKIGRLFRITELGKEMLK